MYKSKNSGAAFNMMNDASILGFPLKMALIWSKECLFTIEKVGQWGEDGTTFLDN